MLRSQPFTRTEALALGVTDKRLRGSDIVRLGHGLYADSTARFGWPSGYETPGHGLGLAALVAVQRQYPEAFFSHATAAHVFKLPLPDSNLSDQDVHLTWAPHASRAQRQGVRSHRHRLLPTERVRFRRLNLTSPARTLIDLASDERLALVDAGLPGPELQVKGDPAERGSPEADPGYRDLKIAIQYDGKHHRSREQQAADAYRDEWFQRHGWLVVRLTWADQAQGFVRLIRLVRERLARPSA